MSENNRLGKGLSSLIGERKGFCKNNTNSSDITNIIISNIKPNKNQPRKSFDTETISELAQSIKEYGLLQPVVVRKLEDNTYELIAGERRFRACKRLGMQTIPAIIKDFDEEKSFALSIIENIQRENLNVVDEAFAYKNLMEVCKFTQNDLAEKVGKSRSYVANIMRLLNLSDKVLSVLKEGKIEMGHARALINYEMADEIIDYIVENKLTVREVEKLVKDETIVDKIKVEKNTETVRSEIILNKENLLKNKLGDFKFKIKMQNKKESGTIVLNFDNLEELDKLIERL